jgi:hypothetical protein
MVRNCIFALRAAASPKWFAGHARGEAHVG